MTRKGESVLIEDVAITIRNVGTMRLWLCPNCNRSRITGGSIAICKCSNCINHYGDGENVLMEHVADITAVNDATEGSLL